MIVPRLIERKRDGGQLAPEEIRELVLAYAEGQVPEYQMAALLMAIYFNGLDRREMNALMATMLESGRQLDFSGLDSPRVDKHSTGGVGDKTSLILAPLIASLGVAVPMMSRRGPGHTGCALGEVCPACSPDTGEPRAASPISWTCTTLTLGRPSGLPRSCSATSITC